MSVRTDNVFALFCDGLSAQKYISCIMLYNIERIVSDTCYKNPLIQEGEKLFHEGWFAGYSVVRVLLAEMKLEMTFPIQYLIPLRLLAGNKPKLSSNGYSRASVLSANSYSIWHTLAATLITAGDRYCDFEFDQHRH